jgi:hypothetical protein
VRHHVFGALRFLVVPTAAILVVAAVAPGRAGLALRIYALVVCGTALVLALIALRRSFPSERPLSVVRRAPPERRNPPSSLARIEHEAALGVAGSFDLHYRLVPRLRSIASGLLEARRRISLERQPDAARAALGDDTWALVEPHRSAPDDRLARGLPADDLARVVDSLEAI